MSFKVFRTSLFKLWPTHWSGGCSSWNPNRIFIEEEKGGGAILFVEHHGSGEGNNKCPTEADYNLAGFVVRAMNTYFSSLGALKIVREEIAKVKRGEKPNFETCEGILDAAIYSLEK